MFDVCTNLPIDKLTTEWTRSLISSNLSCQMGLFWVFLIERGVNTAYFAAWEYCSTTMLNKHKLYILEHIG